MVLKAKCLKVDITIKKYEQKCIFSLWKNSKNNVPRRETDLAMKEREPNHPELKKKMKFPKPPDDTNAITVDIYDKKDKINQI